MTVYQLLRKPDEYQSLTTYGTAGWEEEPHWFSGTPIADEWIPPYLEIYNNDEGTLVPGDFPSFRTFPVFSERAVDALADILRANGELLPIHTPQGVFYAFNVLTVIDALDEEHSEIVRMAGGGILNIARYVFHEDKVRDAVLFTIPQVVYVYTYVTDPFVSRVEEAGLKGFRFDLLWPLPEPEPRRGSRRRRPKAETE